MIARESMKECAASYMKKKRGKLHEKCTRNFISQGSGQDFRL